MRCSWGKPCKCNDNDMSPHLPLLARQMLSTTAIKTRSRYYCMVKREIEHTDTEKNAIGKLQM